MRVLQSWLKDYLKFNIPAEELVERLTMLGLEFESVERLGKQLDGFVVGHVVECTRHPNADRLTVCRVDVGAEVLQIVCGAPNVAAGQKVPVGVVGATVPHNLHDPSGKPFVLGKVSLRGVESSGMICSAAELGVGNDADGILVLKANAPVGRPLAQYFGIEDVALDVEITPNRPDWLSHIGVAREIGVLTGKKPALPRVHAKEGTTPIGKFLKVTVKDRANCPRFAARMIRGVTIAPSPEWLQRRVSGVGLRPRNNVVDITNYVMLECGHPMHAFDYAQLHGGQIVIRQAEEGTSFRTLDGVERKLPAGSVMVCDAEREISIAGVMGGENSEIGDTTVDVVLEGAHWNPSSIRRTAKALGLSTDASQRFERGADPNMVRFALDRAASLILDLAGGTLLKGVIDIYPRPVKERLIPVRTERVNGVLGTAITQTEVARLLGLLDMKAVRKTVSSVTYKVPTYRVDVEKEIDLIEEVARVYGYDNIPEKTHAAIDFGHALERNTLVDRVRGQLVGMGFHDVLTNPMQDEDRCVVPGITPVRVLNPLSRDMAMMRSSLLPGLLQVVAVNQNRGERDLRLYEVGRVFRVDPQSSQKLVGDVVEEERLALAMTGRRNGLGWGNPAGEVDLFDLKGALEGLLQALRLDNHRFIPYSTSESLTEESLRIEVQGIYAGQVGKASSQVLSRFGVEGSVYVAELLLSALAPSQRASFSALPRFPKVRRDVAFVVPRRVQADEIAQVIRDSAGELLADVTVFDLYEGKGLPEGRKSLAFALELMSRQRTLTDAEIEAVVARVVREIETKFEASLRSESTQHAQH